MFRVYIFNYKPFVKNIIVRFCYKYYKYSYITAYYVKSFKYNKYTGIKYNNKEKSYLVYINSVLIKYVNYNGKHVI